MKMLANLLMFVFLFGCANTDTIGNTLNVDHCEIIEKTINLPELQQYYHVSSFPERVPLIVLFNHPTGGCPELNKFESPVKISSPDKSNEFKNKPHIKINMEIVDSDNIKVFFSYIPEGIKGQLKLQKNNSHWAVSESKIVEI